LRIVESILRSQNSILTVSNLISGYYDINDVYLSLPAIINEHGVRNLLELNLDFKEQKALQDAAAKVRSTLNGLDLEPAVTMRRVKTHHRDRERSAE
jgi:L-lactate dehydrogenase